MLDERFWKKYFDTYDVLNELIPYEELMNILLSKLKIKQGNLVLDAGAGTGNLSIKLLQSGANVVALDNSKEGLVSAKNKNRNIETVCHDLTKRLPFVDNYFDKIVSNNVLYTISPEKRQEVVSEFYRILKPGGSIVISNVAEGWKPFEIYKNHLKKDLRKIGFFRLLIKIFKMGLPTLRMFYYNSKIKKEEGECIALEYREQYDLLIKTGFKNVSENLFVYAEQAVLNFGNKSV